MYWFQKDLSETGGVFKISVTTWASYLTSNSLLLNDLIGLLWGCNEIIQTQGLTLYLEHNKDFRNHWELFSVLITKMF